MQARHGILVDETQQAVEAIEFAVDMLERAMSSPYRWRWALFALHQAAQGLMVCALAGSDGTRTLNHGRKDVKQYIAALRDYSSTGKHPEEPPNALDSFLGLYKKVQDRQMMAQFTTSQHFAPPTHFHKHVRSLNAFRNEFQHFGPKKWVLEVAVFIEPARAALELVRFLAFDSHNIVWRKYPEGDWWQELVQYSLRKGTAVLAVMERQCDTGA